MTMDEICRHLEAVIFDNYSVILNRQLVSQLVENIRKKHPDVIQGVIPEKISLALLQKVLSCLLEQRKSIRSLVKILEIMEDEIDRSPDMAKTPLALAYIIGEKLYE
jgi:flagellar biosynthesis protein FlhA